MKFEAKTIKDITGKDLYYIILNNGQKDVIINVGQKNYEKVKDLTKQQELPLPTEKPKK